MKETDLSTKLADHARKTIRNSVVFKIADSFTHGIPDINVNANHRGSWWEVKLADPTFQSFGLQELNCLRLAVVGVCYYVIYDATDSYNKRTLIVHPKNFKQWRDLPFYEAPGFDHDFVVNFMKRCHAA